MRWIGNGAWCQALRGRVGPCHIGLMLLAINRASPFEIIAKGDGSLAISDAIEGEAERMGLVAMF